MISHKLGKSTVLGTRVAVPATEGYYFPATIQAVNSDSTGCEFLTVKLDDNKKREYFSSSVVGNGFKAISDIKLRKLQKVYTIHNGRSVSGYVEQHSDGMVIISLPEFGKDIISRPENEVALIEHRQSPRLNEHHELDYRKLASVNASPSHCIKGPVSANIEVPAGRYSRVRKSSAEPTMDELMAAMVLSNLSSSPVFHNPRSPSIKRESIPHSFGSSGVGSWSQEQQVSPGRSEYHVLYHSTPERQQTVIKHAPSMEHSEASPDDMIDVDATSETSGFQDSGSMASDERPNMEQETFRHSTPTPFQSGSPHQLSASPQNPTFSVKLEAVKEETIDKDLYQDASFQQPSMFYIPSLLPPNLHGFGRPEYAVHMQQVSTPPPPLAPPEERPYREMSPYQIHHIGNEVLVPSPDDNRVYVGSAPPTFYTIPLVASPSLSTSPLTFTPISHIRHTPSPLAATNVSNDGSSSTSLQSLKLTSTSHPIPMSSYAVMQDHPYPSQSAQPINIPTAKAFSWHAPTGFSPKPSILQQRQHMHQAASPKMSMPMSPKSLPLGRKVRGDGKKCRKVYGMENRDMWCTACRWKKACQRFPD